MDGFPWIFDSVSGRPRTVLPWIRASVSGRPRTVLPSFPVPLGGLHYK